MAITIEGASTSEIVDGDSVIDGEEIIDVGEYYGNTEIAQATLVRYVQLKHSTLRQQEVWQPSGLKKTIEGWAKRFVALGQKFPAIPLSERLEFVFVTNRPINVTFVETLEDVRAKKISRHPKVLEKLEGYTSLSGASLALFAQTLKFEADQGDYWQQRNILTQDVSGYLPSNDVDAPVRLKELVTRKALSESADNPSITRMDVLRALQVNETQLFPAPCLVAQLKNTIARTQEGTLIGSIVSAIDRPIAIRADSGVGKTIFSTQIGRQLPEGSVSIVYDCFGNGQYRSASGYRHGHRTALVQIANELSAIGLCHPLIPTSNADASDYIRAFIYRLGQSISILRARNREALLCIILDAADNAQMAAEEINEPRSFAYDLLREHFPEGVRLVALCRPHRLSKLNPPSNILALDLEPFSRDETRRHLRQQFPNATEHDVDEFHRLSSRNPRVQALYLARGSELPEILRLLGPNPTTVESAIGDLLEGSIAKLRDSAGHIEAAQIDLICEAMAALRPLIPISVLEAISNVSQAAIRSFALDFGRPLIVNGDTLQFFDEPAESWFRERYKPTLESAQAFVKRLTGLAVKSSYVASVLPQLMLEAGQLTELVETALTSSGLPEANPVDRRDVELQRLQFALKAALRAQRYSDAAKLALKAGGETAGDDRQCTLFQDNIDLTARFFSSTSAQELVSRGIFGSGWTGSQHAYESALLSGHEELVGEARSRLRMAEEWLTNWSKLTPDERANEPVSEGDRAVMATAHLQIHGSAEAAIYLRRWRNREASYSAGRIMSRRLLDHGRWDDLNNLAIAAGNDIGLLLAIAQEARSVHRFPPKEAAQRAFKLLRSPRVQVVYPDRYNEIALTAITALVESSIRQDLCTASEAIALLQRYLPSDFPPALASRHSHLRPNYLRAYALKAALAGLPLELRDLADVKLREEIENERLHNSSSELRQLKEVIGELLPWYNLWARAFLRQVGSEDADQEIANARALSSKARGSYQEAGYSGGDVVGIWIDVLVETGKADCASIGEIAEWSEVPANRIFTPTLNRLSRIAGRIKGAESFAFEFASRAFSMLNEERSDAQNKIEGYVELSRSVLQTSPAEAEAYFNKAVEVASKIGDENLARWDALIALAEKSSDKSRPAPEVAYKFARCAEVTWDFVERDKHFAWNDTVDALTHLCPTSSLAIISRWRDRRFGNDGRVLALAIESLVADGSLNPLDAVAMVGFVAEWDESTLLNAALRVCVDIEQKKRVLGLVYRYMSLSLQSSAKWKSLQEIADREGINVLGLDTTVECAVAVESKEQTRRDYSNVVPALENDARDWDQIFGQCDLTTPTGISAARVRFRSSDPPFDFESFCKEAIRRLPIGKESEFLRAFGDIADFDLFSIGDLLNAYPQQWKDRLAVRAALAYTVKAFCRRFSLEIKRNRYYAIFPFDKACELSGLSESELLDVILAEAGESMGLAGPGELFNLVQLLSTKLTCDQALETLAFGLDLFNVVLKHSDGDGDWSADLLPPTKIEEALAGYVWSALASPDAACRWQAAHVIVAMCAIGRNDALAAVIKYTTSNASTAFFDARFEFYFLHAKQWLLIGMSKAALDYGPTISPYANFLVSCTRECHVLFRMFAARALLALNSQSVVSFDDQELQQLVDVNRSTFEELVQDSSADSSEGDKTQTKTEIPDSDRYFFGIDFGPYWLAPLGGCFGLTEVQTELETLRAIRGDLGYKGSHRWDEDARSRLRLYPYEKTSHSHGTAPQVDDEGFYRSYHAMFITAARLLATKPLARGEHSWDTDQFAEWLASHDLTRRDGRWLFDRRDALPDFRTSWLDESDKEAWLKSISVDSFDSALIPEPKCCNVWGYWTNTYGSYEETVSVSSALVSRSKSASLVRALQTVIEPYDYRIPSANDELEIDKAAFVLKGWVTNLYQDSGLDEKDLWAGVVRYPAPEPATFVVQAMNLSTDVDRRVWTSQQNGELALRSEAWGELEDRDSAPKPNGRRLKASHAFLKAFLTEEGMDLIIEIEITRKNRDGRYERGAENGDHRIPPSTRIVLFKNDGTVTTS